MAENLAQRTRDRMKRYGIPAGTDDPTLLALGASRICDCRSYNRRVGDRDEVPLDPPRWLQEMRDHDQPARPVMVDACIAEAVRALWDAGHVTLGSCCGHGGRVNDRPSLVLGDGERDFDAIRAVLAAVDGREWELLQWRLVEVDRG